jgi:MFS transporter, FHS family, Na+ dependent glucose transporter 1
MSSIPVAPSTTAQHKAVPSATYLGSFVALGLSTAVVGPSLDKLSQRVSVSKGTIGILLTVGALGYFCGALLAGQLLGRLQANHAAILGVGGLLIGLMMTAIAPSFWLLVVAQFIFGVGGAGLDVTGNSVILWLHQGGPVMAGLHMCFSLGAILAPNIVAWSLKRTSEVRLSFLLVASLMAVVVITMLLTKAPANPHVNETTTKVALTGRQPQLLGLGVLFYVTAVGVEVSIISWIVDYGVARKLERETTATQLATTFLFAFFIGRLLSVPIAKFGKPFVILLVDLAITMGGLTIMLVVADRQAMWIGCALVGLGLASLFPAMLSMAEPVLPSTGLVTSSFLAGSSVGSMTFPVAIGYLLTKSGADALPAVMLAGSAACLVTVLAFNAVAKAHVHAVSAQTGSVHG